MVYLRVNAQLEVESLEGDILQAAQLSLLRKASKNLGLYLDPALFHAQKIYLEPQTGLSLEAQLWQEVEKAEDCRLKMVFYDYAEVVSQLPDLHAYQFFWIEKQKIKPVLRFLKKNRFRKIQLCVETAPHINLWPWRMEVQRLRLLKNVGLVGIAPLLLSLVLLSVWGLLLYANHHLLSERKAVETQFFLRHATVSEVRAQLPLAIQKLKAETSSLQEAPSDSAEDEDET